MWVKAKIHVFQLQIFNMNFLDSFSTLHNDYLKWCLKRFCLVYSSRYSNDDSFRNFIKTPKLWVRESCTRLGNCPINGNFYGTFCSFLSDHFRNLQLVCYFRWCNNELESFIKSLTFCSLSNLPHHFGKLDKLQILSMLSELCSYIHSLESKKSRILCAIRENKDIKCIFTYKKGKFIEI